MSIREHGGAVRFWRNKMTGQRACLCRDETLLHLVHGKWQPLIKPVPWLDDWEDDTRPSISAAITRTNREARRGSKT